MIRKPVLLALLLSFALLLTACGPSPTTTSPTPTVEMEEPTTTATTSPPTATPVPPTSTREATPSPTTEAPPLPVASGPQPNGTFVTQEVRRVDLRGDGQEEFIATSFWQEGPDADFATPLQVDVVTADGTVLFSRNTWEIMGVGSPGEMDLEEYSLFMFDQIQDVRVLDLTGADVPELAVHVRRQGTGSILEIEVVSLQGGEVERLFERTAYKGGVNYTDEGLTVTQPLYLYNEANCCPCRLESVAYVWNGERFAPESRTVAPIEDGVEGCPDFPQPARWEQVEVSGAPPPARRDALLIHDTRRERLVLFGGRGGGTPLDDTWAFDLGAGTWERIVPEDGLRPPARHNMVGGVDEARNRLIITTGQGAGGGVFNDVWAFDLTTDTWSQISPSGTAPSPRYGAAGGIFFFADQLYLTHGFTDVGRFNDTWLFDLATETWRDVTPADEVPLRRCLHAGALTGPDSLVIFGGCAAPVGPCPLDDGWLFAGQEGAWQQLAAETLGPPARQFATLGALNDRSELVLFGGLGDDDTELIDVWIFDRIMEGWRQIEPEGESPSARYGAAMSRVSVFTGEPTGDFFAIFGGRSGDSDLNDLWRLIPGDE